MLVRQRHRGPDASGYEVHQGRLSLVVGSTRLRVQDLSSSADMPLRSDDGSVAVVFNGEIYNAVELRNALRAKGYRFKTTSDTECILASYLLNRDRPSEAFRVLDGMFAIAILDKRRERVLLARDRCGIKPLFYRQSGRDLHFASEARVLGDDESVDPDAVLDFLSAGWVAGGRSMWKGVVSLTPGHYLTISQEGVVDAQFRAIDFAEPREATNQHDLARAFDAGMKRHLVSDRKVGVFLSGGLDSRLIANAAAKSANVSALTVTFPDATHLSEWSQAKITADKAGLHHVEVPVTSHDSTQILINAASAMDQPSADALNSFIVCQAAAEAGFVVALSGLGSDEIFDGYGLSRGVRRLRLARDIARIVPSSGVPRSLRMRGDWHRLRFDRVGGLPYHAARGLFALPSELDHPTRAGRNYSAGELSRSRALLRREMTEYLRFQLLADSDSMSMHHSLEVRVPFLDDVFLNTALALPERLRIRKRKALLVGGAVQEVPLKRGFELPLQMWLGTSLKPLVEHALSGQGPLAGLFTHASRVALKRAVSHPHLWRSVFAVTVLAAWADVHRVEIPALSLDLRLEA